MPEDYRKEVNLRDLERDNASLLKFNNQFYEVPTK
jgi:hypothetical protein